MGILLCLLNLLTEVSVCKSCLYQEINLVRKTCMYQVLSSHLEADIHTGYAFGW